jgi:hypothetical protein
VVAVVPLGDKDGHAEQIAERGVQLRYGFIKGHHARAQHSPSASRASARHLRVYVAMSPSLRLFAVLVRVIKFFNELVCILGRPDFGITQFRIIPHTLRLPKALFHAIPFVEPTPRRLDIRFIVKVHATCHVLIMFLFHVTQWLNRHTLVFFWSGVVIWVHIVREPRKICAHLHMMHWIRLTEREKLAWPSGPMIDITSSTIHRPTYHIHAVFDRIHDNDREDEISKDHFE